VKNLLICLIALMSFLEAKAQLVLENQIVDSSKIIRSEYQFLRHLEREQTRIDYADGVKDTFLNLDGDMLRSKAISEACFDKANQINYFIFNNFEERDERRSYLAFLIKKLQNINDELDQGNFDVNKHKSILFQNFELLKAIKDSTVEKYLEANADQHLYRLEGLLDADPKNKSKLIAETAQHFPEKLIVRLADIEDEAVADLIVSKTAQSNPKLLLNYASSTSVERDIVRRSKDSLVQSLIKLGDESNTALKAIYFLDDFHNGKMSIAQINKTTSSKSSYYKSLVAQLNTATEVNRKSQLSKELHQETKYYVQKMNELHFQSGAVRFASIKGFNANELYYVITEGDQDFYTSSYTGLFSRFITKLKGKNGYAFLNDLNFTNFRRFIRLGGNYNTLNTFLRTMKQTQRDSLMSMFVGNLGGNLQESLEGAIDVATTYSSIRDSKLKDQLVSEVQMNKQKAKEIDNRLAYRIYHILNVLFTGNDSTVTAELGVPPISSLPISSLQNDSGVIIQQIFFPGDEDGKGVFNGFVRRHSNSKWTKHSHPQWVIYESKGKNKVIKFANLPLDEPNDEFAQKALQEYLISNNLKPTIIVQRGHSYHVATTLDQLQPSNKIIVLGACGGFNNLETIMSKSPEAQIISTKQVGSGRVNWPILDYLDRDLLAGRDVDWIRMWTDLGRSLKGNPLFKDYVPPHKNLGSLFLKAFYRTSLVD